jgi:hypothetical protein
VWLGHEYLSCVSVCDALGCRSVVCPNGYNIPGEATALSRINEPIFNIMMPKVNNDVDCVDCGMGLAIM